MSHHHHHNHHSGHTHGLSNLGIAFFLNLAFTVIEIIGGLMTNSLAILSDALHDLGDSLSLGLAWYFEKLSTKKSDKKFSYGYKRFSLLGAIINSVVLIIGSVFILINAIPRFIDPEPTDARGMFMLAVLGIVINGLAVWRLKGGHSINEKVVSLHLLEDVLGWVAVLIGAIVIYFTDFFIIDPILSVGITLFILYNVYRNIRSSLNIILQGIPEHINLGQIEKSLREIPDVVSIHDLHIWSLDGARNILTVHIVLGNKNGNLIQKKIKESAKQKMLVYGIDHCTIEFEDVGDACALIEC